MAQSVVFHKVYGYSSTGHDFGNCVIEAQDSGFIAGGDTYSLPTGEGYYAVRVDRHGDTVWQSAHDYSVPGGDAILSMVGLPDGDILACGATFDTIEGAAETFFLRLDSSGNAKWHRTYDAGFNDWPKMMKKLTDSTVVVAGRFHDPDTLAKVTLFLLVADTSGTVLWQQDYFGWFSIYPRSVDLTADGGFVIGGYFLSAASNSWDLFLLKTDSEGEMEWFRRYGDGRDEIGGYSIATSDSGYAIVGYRFLDASGDISAGYFVKTDENGEVQWQRLYDNRVNDIDLLSHVQQLASNSYVVAGATWVEDAFSVWLLKLDPYGDTLWTRGYSYYGGTTLTRAEDLKVTSDGGFILAGWIINNGLPARNDLWLLKTDSLGRTCSPPPCSGVIEVVEGVSAAQGSELTIHPNPASGYVMITSSLSTQAEFVLHDVTGREVLRQTVQAHQAVVIELGGLHAGLYVYEARSGDFRSTGKLLVIKE